MSDVLEKIERGEMLLFKANEDASCITLASSDLKKELLRLAKIGQRARWIPVKKRRPDDGDIIDIYTPDGREIGKIYFEEDLHAGEYCVGEFTHWRLSKNDRPELPGEEKP